MVQLVKTCCYCRVRKDNLLKCSKCRKATYCSRNCQVNHWSHHKSVCKLVCESYTVEIKMSETQSLTNCQYECTVSSRSVWRSTMHRKEINCLYECTVSFRSVWGSTTYRKEINCLYE
jgi:hypothetical protein